MRTSAGFLMGGLALAVPASHVQAQVPVQPNIVFICTDDQAPWAFGSAVERGLYADVPAAHTPNLDRLMGEGAYLTNFHCATPVCSPARAALMTGRYASEFGIEDFIVQPGHKLYADAAKVALDPDASITFAEVLHDSGYATGLVGKWHLGDWTEPGEERYHPTHHGFDYFMGLTGGGCPTENPELEEDGKVRKFEGLTTDILADRALAFIDAHKDGPFLLNWHTRAPHAAWLPVAPEDWAPFANMDPTIPDAPGLDREKIKKQMREYLASVNGVDRNVGRVLARIDELGLRDNTIVIFTSDHGYNMGHNGIWHKGNGIWATEQKPPGEVYLGTRVISDKYRPNMYELSMKVPAIVRWPGVVKPGTVIDAVGSALDFFPTVVEMAGAKLPDGDPLRGRSLVPLLRGEPPADWRDEYFGEYHMINYVEADMRSYRTKRWKLIRDFHNEGRDEFYELEIDPAESKNLIGSDDLEVKEAIVALDKKLRAKMVEIGGSPGPAHLAVPVAN